METQNWRAWRDTSTDGEACVRVDGQCLTPSPGYGIELQRHGSAQGAAGNANGASGGTDELVLDLIVRPPRDERGGDTVVMAANYVFEEGAGEVRRVVVRQGGREIARMDVEAETAGGSGRLGAGQAARASSTSRSS